MGACAKLSGMHIGVLGGTGPAGGGSRPGSPRSGHRRHPGIAGPDRAEGRRRARARAGATGSPTLEPGTNHDAADAELVVLATVCGRRRPDRPAPRRPARGKIVISMANGLEKRGRQFVPRPARGLDRRRGEGRSARRAYVVAAFHLVPRRGARRHRRAPLTGDVLVVGDEDEARTTVLDLVDSIPDLRAFDAGPLENAIGLETVLRRPAHRQPPAQGRRLAPHRGRRAPHAR